MTASDHAWLDRIRAILPITEVVSGEARGADREGEIWARLSGLKVSRFPANWTRYGSCAGPIRNADMADYAEACIAFPGGTGTADMLRKAHGKGLKVFIHGHSYCQKCHKEMRHNVPRLGPAGGWVHADTGYVLCGPRPEQAITCSLDPWDDFPPGGCHASSDIRASMNKS